MGKLRRTAPFALLLLVAAACSDASEPGEPNRVQMQKGMSFTGWYREAYEGADAERSMANLAETGAGWVAIVTTWFQATIASTDISPTNETPTEAGLVHMIRTAHRLGLKVMLKPHIGFTKDPDYSRPGIGTAWGGDPGALDRWFASYRAFIFHFADLAQTEGVEEFAVGTELPGVSGHTERWREIVRGVRERYSGLLTYAALIDSEETTLQWWDAVDLIGIDVYYALTDEFAPTVDELKAAWAPRVQRFADLSAAWGDRPIVFTEIGYRSIDGANTNPWDWMWDQPVDLQEQADCYQAALESVWDEPWFAGVYWWDWTADPHVGGPSDTGFTPFGKPAEDVLRSWY